MLYTLFSYEKTVGNQPGVTLKHAKEGTESSAFWSALGGKQAYTSKKVVNEVVRDPHLFTISFYKGNLFLSCYLLYNIIMQLHIIDWYTDHFSFSIVGPPGKFKVSFVTATSLIFPYLYEICIQ